MGFGTVIANSIMIIMTFIIIGIVIFMFISMVTTINASVSEATKQLKHATNFNLLIPGIIYNDTTNTLYINITNEGSRSLVFGIGYEILIDYTDIQGRRNIELKTFGQWTLSAIYIGDKVTKVESRMSIEFIPGATVEVKLNPSKTIMPNSTIIVVLISPRGCTSEYMAEVK